MQYPVEGNACTVNNRIVKEVARMLSDDGIAWTTQGRIQFFLTEDDDPFHFKAILQGPEGSPYRSRVHAPDHCS